MNANPTIKKHEGHGVASTSHFNEGTSVRGVTTGLGGFESSGVGLGQQHGFMSQNLHKRRTHKATVSFRPLEAILYRDKEVVGHINPYCKFKIGWGRAKTEVAMVQPASEGLTDLQDTKFAWGDTIILKLKNEKSASLTVKDKDRPMFSNRLGKSKIPLDKVIQEGIVNTWIPLELNGEETGQIQVEMEYQPPSNRQ